MLARGAENPPLRFQHPTLSLHHPLLCLPALHAAICIHFQAAACTGTGFWGEGGGKFCLPQVPVFAQATRKQVVLF